jgi:hypothetical protein
VVGPGGPLTFTGLALEGQQAAVTPTAGAYTVTLFAGFDLAGLHREVKKTLNVVVSWGGWTAPGLVAGAAWTITFEFSPFGFLDVGQVGPFVIGDWYQSGIVRSATYTIKDYLVMTLTADYPTRPNYAEL